MEQLEIAMNRVGDVWTTVPSLLIVAVGLIGWFPGHNARRKAHPQAALVNSAGWWLVGLTIASALWEPTQLICGPAFIVCWTGLTVWSYGKTEAVQATFKSPAFEVMMTPEPAPVPVVAAFNPPVEPA